jgi:hypothetical protein
MTLHFQCTPKELYRATQAAVRRLQDPRLRRRRRIFPWLRLAAVLAIVIAYFWWNERPDVSADGTDLHAPIFVRLLPWIFVFLWIVFFVGLRQWSYHTKWVNHPCENLPQVLQLDSRRLVLDQPGLQVELPWESIWGLEETPEAFLLFTTDPVQAGTARFIAIPKHALVEHDAPDELRQFLAQHVTTALPACPVVAVAPVTGATVAFMRID